MYLQDVSIPNYQEKQSVDSAKNAVWFLHDIPLETADLIRTIEFDDTSFDGDIIRKWRTDLFGKNESM